MDPQANTPESIAREFVARFGREEFADAVALLTDTGRKQVVDSFPAAFAGRELDARGALEAYRWGLYDRYGEFEGVGEVSARDGEAAVELEHAGGSETATVGVDDGGVTDLSFDPEYEPPEYADRNAFDEREVVVDAGDVELGGVLSVPAGDGPFPGVVLVHGHGIHDPDGSAGASKLLTDLAWGLTSRGIVTLRYEKRLLGHEVADDEYTLDTVVVDDAVAAVETLAGIEAVAPDSVFVAGHSQGGMCAPRIAARHGGLASAVNLDGAADPVADPDDLAWLRYSMDPDGDLDERQAEELEARRETFRRIAEGDFDDGETIDGYPGVWHRSHLEYDPVATACDLDVPVFVACTFRVDAERQADLLAWRGEQTAAWKEASLPAGSRVESYEDVGHYLQAGPTPRRPIGLFFGGNVEPYVVTDVAEWVHEVASG